MNRFIIMLSMIVLPNAVSAFIPPTRTILQKAAEHAGSGIYAIEQEVQFQNGQDVINLKETWLIDNERTMRLTVSGTKEQQGSIKFQFLYVGGQRYRLVDGSRKTEPVSEEFLEKYFNFRNPETFANNLVAAKILPAGAFNKKPSPKNGTDYKYEEESWIRYSRTGGVVNYAFGTPTPADQDSLPGLWIEQDHFVLRKIRLPSKVEMTADNYNIFSRGLHYPRARTIRWGNNSVNIRLISASARPASVNSLFQPSSLEIPQKLEGLGDLPAKEAILEFYSRFR